MSKMAILISSDDWKKVEDYKNFLSKKPRAIWRTQGRNRQDKLNEIPSPINLYFFHKNIIKYKARCIRIRRAETWPLKDIPPEYRSDSTRYRLFIEIDKLDSVDDTHISKFPKWGKQKKEYFKQGQMGLLRIVDILDQIGGVYTM